MRGSKYVQSDLGDTFRQARALLEAGTPVLFSGVPCQIDGLLRFLGRDYEHLLTCDLVCHGVPSPGGIPCLAGYAGGAAGLHGPPGPL